MRRWGILFALGLVTQIGSTLAATPSDLGFDPAKFGLPIYPNAKLMPGTAVPIQNGAGHVRHSAVLTTADPEEKVAAWYAAHWKGARHHVFPHMHMDQFATGFGLSSVGVQITNPAGETEIHVMAPGK